jgi:hypothetical protein
MVKGAVYDPELLFMPVPGAKQAGQAVGAVTRPVVNAVKATAQVPVDVAKGALGRATGYIAEPGVAPKGYQVPSSRIPLGETFIPATEMAELQRGMPISEGAIRPISELAPGPVLALSGGEIPVAGRAAQAYGERLGETYRNPLTAAADIGSMFFTGGIPVLTAGRSALGLAQAGADAYLARKGFASLTPEQQATLNAGGNPFYAAGPAMPKAQPMPQPTVTAQPVAPQSVPQLTYNPTPSVMYGTESGIVGKSPQAVVEADLKQRYAPQPVAPVAPEPVTAPASAVDTAAQQLSSEARKQQVLDMIRARTQPAPETPAVTVAPVAPVEVPVSTASPLEQMFGIKPKSETVDLAANRATFADTVQQTRENLTAAREQNKNMFGDRAKDMNQRAGMGSMMANPKDYISEGKAVRHLINQTLQGAVKQQNKVVSYSKPLMNDFATQTGTVLDWTTAPDISKMSVGDARKVLNKWMFDSIDAQNPELGLKTRRESYSVQQRQAERAMAGQPEVEITQADRDALAKRQQLLGVTSGQTTGTTPVGPSSALQAALDRAKAQGKYKPPGVMEMIADTAPRQVGKFDNVYPNKEAMDYDTLFSTLGEKNPRIKRYQEGNTIVEVEQIDYGTIPKEYLQQMNKPSTKTRTYDAKTGKQISGPPVEVPEKPLRQRVEDILNRRK